MALPTLRPYYITRGNKIQTEQKIIARQTREADRQDRWSKHSRYFHDSDIKSSKQEACKSFHDRCVYVHILVVFSQTSAL